MLIPYEKIQEIIFANDITAVISEYITVKKRGKSFLALCPFHQDRNPSLHISQEKQVYHCFSCKAGGNVISFVQNYEKIGFIDAARKLAERAGIALSFTGKGHDVSNEMSMLYGINEAAAEYFRKMLDKVKGNEREFLYSYMKSRGIDEETAADFGIGYSLNKWDALLNHFAEEGSFNAEDIEKAGLLIRRENEKEGYYDRFRGRLMFPICNESGKVVGFGGRKILEEDQGGKYINSPETKVYNKSKILYGLNLARDQIKYAGSAILVEGYMDLISMYKKGIRNVIASSGTALTPEQVKLLSRYTEKVFVLFDSDSAGVSAARRGIETILAGGLDVRVITLPDGEDPDSFLKKKSKEDFAELVSNGKQFIDFAAQVYSGDNDIKTAEGKSAFVRELIAVLSKVPDKIKRTFYLKEIAERYLIPESLLNEELAKTISRAKPDFPQSSVVIPDREFRAPGQKAPAKIPVSEKDLVKVLIRGDREAVSFLEENVDMAHISNGGIQRIVEQLLDECINHEEIDVSRIVNSGIDEECTMILMDAASDKYEPSYFKDSSFDSLLDNETKQVYSLEYAKGVIRSLEVDFCRRQIEILKADPSNISEVFRFKKRMSQLMKGKQWQE